MLRVPSGTQPHCTLLPYSTRSGSRERGRRPQGTGQVLRGVGTDARAHPRGAPSALVDHVLMRSAAASGPRLPETVPVFPLPGVLLLPRAQLPLHIFEPRYRAMVRDALAGDSMLAMIQPSGEPADATEAANTPIYTVGRSEEHPSEHQYRMHRSDAD